MKWVDNDKNIQLYNGDANIVLNLLKDNFKVQSIMTSPPYFNLRDYEVDGQIGMEKSVNDYITNLCNIFDKCKEILKDDGICFVNISDTYSKKGELLCVPDRFKIEMIKRGWICRNEIIWHKPNAMPSSVKNRFNQDYEKIYMFVKNKYYKFNTQYEDRKTKPSKLPNIACGNSGKYKNVEHESLHRQGMNKTRGTKLIEKRDLPPQEVFVEELRRNFTKKEIIEKTGLKETTVAHWFRKDKGGFSYPKREEWLLLNTQLMPYLTEVYYETDDINKNQDKGRIKRSVWSINTKPNKEKHFATYPEELCVTPILASTDIGDVVLDPFNGSGTTGIVALKLNRKYIGIELNNEYFEISKKRLMEA